MSASVPTRLTARPATPERGQGDTGRAMAALARIAELHQDLSSAYRDLVRDLDIQLADLGSQSDLSGMTTPTPGPELITAADIAERLCVKEKTIRRWERDGRIPKARRICGMLRWPAVEFDEWLAGGSDSPGANTENER